MANEWPNHIWQEHSLNEQHDLIYNETILRNPVT